MTCAQSQWTFHEGDLDRADVIDLLALHWQAMRSSSPPDACHVLAIDSLRALDVSFWSLREKALLLGVGALKQLSRDHGEIKSMRTNPSVVGRGVGSAMLHHIISEGRQRGLTRLSLETGSTGIFQPAIRLYERHGFVRCEPFGDYKPTPFNIFYTRAI